MNANIFSHGIRGGTIREPSKYPRFCSWNLHNPSLDTDADRKGHRPTTTSKFHPDGSPAAPPRLSKKPFLVFLLAAFGLPYLMGKLIRSLAASQDEAEKQRLAAAGMQIGPDGQPIPVQPVDPSKLDFCKVLYDFTPESGAAVQGVDLEVKKGDMVAVLSKSDPMGNPSEWWRCRARDGRMGYLPGVYLAPAGRPGQAIAAIKSASQSGSRASSLDSKTVPPTVQGKAGDLSVESFQKSQFYS
jgi:peroxin-13